MSQDTLHDVMVMGSGFAGMAAALFASDRGLSVVQTGATGGIDFSTGFIDLMAVHPIAEGRRWDDPWAAIKALGEDCPRHPYARIAPGTILTAVDNFTRFLESQGLPYRGFPDRNVCIASPVGTIKRTFRVPESTWNGVEALAQQAPTLIVDFQGLKGFSARQMKETLGHAWPTVTTARAPFPGATGELYPEHMAWAMADPKNRETLAESIRPSIGDAEYIGFPAVMGLYTPMEILDHLRDLTGKHVFEIPTLPPSIAGNRLRAAFDRSLSTRGVRTLSQKLVKHVERNADGTFTFTTGDAAGTQTVKARTAILATGRFFGKGLRGTRTVVREPVFGIPVVQPASREQWHNRNFFDLHGHPVNLAGLETDEHLCPLVAPGKRVYDNLFAAGAVLAHQDWARMKCGAGLAIATAYKAVEAAADIC